MRKDAEYYKKVSEAKKLAQNGISELDFNNAANALNFFKKAVAILEPYGQWSSFNILF